MVAGAVTAVVGYWALTLLGGTGEQSLALGSIAGAVTVIFATGALMLFVYVLVLKLLRVPEIDTALKGITGILRR
jgi:hypothetical protein